MLKRTRNELTKKRQDAKDLIGMIEKLPEEKKREVLGIVRGYSLCTETEKKASSKTDREEKNQTDAIMLHYGNPDNQGRIHFREVVHVIIKSIVVIDGEEVEIKDMDDKDAFAESVNERVLLERHYIAEEQT